MSAPSWRNASTSLPMGRSCMRREPVSRRVPGVMASSAVTKRMAVPAAPMSMLEGDAGEGQPLLRSCDIVASARSMADVSSQSETLDSRPTLPPLKAVSNKARLLMLLLEGRVTSAERFSGFETRYFIKKHLLFEFFGTKVAKNLHMTKKMPYFAPAKRKKRHKGLKQAPLCDTPLCK